MSTLSKNNPPVKPIRIPGSEPPDRPRLVRTRPPIDDEDDDEADYHRIPGAPEIDTVIGANYTPVGVADRFVRIHGDKVRFDSGAWFLWDGQRWASDGNTFSKVRELVRDVRSYMIQKERTKPKYEEVRAKMIRDAATVSGIDAILKLSQAQLIPPTPFDGPNTDLLLNCQNGVLDLTTRELYSHDDAEVRNLGFTTLSAAHFLPSATCPRFDAFISMAMGDDPSLIAYVKRCMGLWITGLSRKHFFLMAGVPDSGKSSLVAYVGAVLGELYQKLSREFFKHNAHSTSQADLHGKRLALLSELVKGTQVDSGLMKELTGDDGSAAHKMHKDNATARQTWSLALSANKIGPGGLLLDPSDDALWNRCVLLYFAHSIPDISMSDDVKEAIKKEECEGILNRCLEGLADYYERGQKLDPPDSVKEELRLIRSRCACADSDLWREAIADHIASFPGGFNESYEDALGEVQKGALLSHNTVNHEPCALTINNCWTIIEKRTESKVNQNDRKLIPLNAVLAALGLEGRKEHLADLNKTMHIYAPAKGQKYVRERDVRAKFLTDARTYLTVVKGEYAAKLSKYYDGVDLVDLLLARLIEFADVEKLRKIDAGLVEVCKVAAKCAAAPTPTAEVQTPTPTDDVEVPIVPVRIVPSKKQEEFLAKLAAGKLPGLGQSSAEDDA